MFSCFKEESFVFKQKGTVVTPFSNENGYSDLDGVGRGVELIGKNVKRIQH